MVRYLFQANRRIIVSTHSVCRCGQFQSAKWSYNENGILRLFDVALINNATMNLATYPFFTR